MAIERNIITAPKSPAEETAANNTKPQPVVWMNIGFTSTDPSTGEEMFVSLPLGLGIDTMLEAKVRGSNVEYNQLVQAKNALLNQLQDAAGQMTPGEEFIINDLQIQMRRVADAVPAGAPGDNPHMHTLNSLGFKKSA